MQINAVSDSSNSVGLLPSNDKVFTQVVNLTSTDPGNQGTGSLAIRNIGLTDLVEQIFTGLKPNTPYTLSLSKSVNATFTSDYELNSFLTHATGKYLGQSTGLIKKLDPNLNIASYRHIILTENKNSQVLLLDNAQSK